MKSKNSVSARTIKANIDIPSLGLRKEDVLTCTADYPDNKTFMFKEDNFSEGFSMSTEISISDIIILENIDSFTLIDSFIIPEPKKLFVNLYNLSILDFDQLAEAYIAIANEMERRVDEKILREDQQSVRGSRPEPGDCCECC
jgi:hypothetical protein